MQDRSFVLQFVSSPSRSFTSALLYVAEHLRSDREVVIAAIKRHPGALEFASEALKDDRECVLAAGSLEHASSRLRGNRKLLLDIVAQKKQN